MTGLRAEVHDRTGVTMQFLRFRTVSLVAVLFLLPVGAVAQEGRKKQAAAPPDAKVEETEAERRRQHDEAAAIFRKAIGHYQARRYGDAMKLLKEAVGRLRTLYPENENPRGHPDLAVGLYWLGVVHQAQSDHRQARRYYEEALTMRRRCFPESKYPRGHPELAQSLDRLGVLLRVEGEYREARKYYEEALAMWRRLYPATEFPRGHAALATALSNLGILLRAQGEYGEARKYLEESLAMTRRLYPESEYPLGHSSLAASLETLALLDQSQSEYDAARKHYEEALAMLKRLFPEAELAGGNARLATTLHNLGGLLEEQGELSEARKRFEESLRMWRHLYPETRYPNGSSRLASSLDGLGRVLMAQGQYREAREYYEEALAMRTSVYSVALYPRGHPRLASSLNSLGDLLRTTGDYGEARLFYEKTLAMRRRLYPASEYPSGHRLLAQSLTGLGVLLRTQGEYGEARKYYEKALAMYRRLYPTSEYPQGHPYLAVSLTNMGAVLMTQGEYDEAKRYQLEALAAYRQLYPSSEYPRGHAYVVASLTHLGLLHSRKEQYSEARKYYEEALAMDRRLYPPGEYPAGHTELAGSLSNLGLLFADQGDYGSAGRYLNEAVSMTKRLYPPNEYGSGHPDLAERLENFAMVLHRQGREEDAAEVLFDAAGMRHRLALLFLAGSSEAEALNFVAAHLSMPHRLISAWRRTSRSESELYGQIWSRRGLIQRLLSKRRKLLQDSLVDSLGERYRRYLEVRRELARLSLAPAASDPGQANRRRERLKNLSDEKEKLERALVAARPDFHRRVEELRRPHTDLAKTLPETSVFVDVVYYIDIEQDPDVPGRRGVRETPSYVAFVARRGEAVRLVNVGAAERIDEAVLAWREDIRDGRVRAHPTDLRRWLWEPLEAHFPPGRPTTVYLCLSGRLSTMPWAALRGRREGSVLLEDYELATVPNGQFLLEQLERGPPAAGKNQRLLAVGDVAYDRRKDAPRVSDSLAAVRADQRGSWYRLPATRDEVEMVAGLARKSGSRRVRILSGTEASPDRVLKDLPRARWAHFATHGFFAGPEFRSKMQLDPQLFEKEQKYQGERTTAAGRNPLVLSGLVLAGANLAPEKDEYGITRGDDGLLTAEAIAAMRLEGLELAVLSACETGLGEVAGGEGVYGLERAFHQAGTRNVVASLWKVDDEATAALMRLFYHGLWVEKAPALEALRRAQLAIYNEPKRVGELARTRGDLDVNDIVDLTGEARDRRTEKTAPTRLWAAFVLSGVGK